MSIDKTAPRRERVERNIYRRATGVFEVGFKDAAGKQRWRTVDGGITAARGPENVANGRLGQIALFLQQLMRAHSGDIDTQILQNLSRRMFRLSTSSMGVPW